MLSWTQPSPHPKRYLDRFSRFLNTSRHTAPILYNGLPLPLRFRADISTLIKYMFPWIHLSPYLKQYLNRFSGFCMTHDHGTDRQTDRPLYSVCNNRLRLRIVLRCGQLITKPHATTDWKSLVNGAIFTLTMNENSGFRKRERGSRHTPCHHRY